MPRASPVGTPRSVEGEGQEYSKSPRCYKEAPSAICCHRTCINEATGSLEVCGIAQLRKVKLMLGPGERWACTSECRTWAGRNCIIEDSSGHRSLCWRVSVCITCKIFCMGGDGLGVAGAHTVLDYHLSNWHGRPTISWKHIVPCVYTVCSSRIRWMLGACTMRLLCAQGCGTKSTGL